MPDADAHRTTIRAMLDFYKRILGQMDALHLGVAFQDEGLFIRSRLVPRAGTDAAGAASPGWPRSSAAA